MATPATATLGPKVDRSTVARELTACLRPRVFTVAGLMAHQRADGEEMGLGHGTLPCGVSYSVVASATWIQVGYDAMVVVKLWMGGVSRAEAERIRCSLHADWRQHPGTLEQESDNGGPITFSFQIQGQWLGQTSIHVEVNPGVS